MTPARCLALTLVVLLPGPGRKRHLHTGTGGACSYHPDRAAYCGTGIADHAVRGLRSPVLTQCIELALAHAMSGTDLAYGPSVRAMRCAVLT
eukprot:3656123-Rhodomonas_salina.2